MKTKLKYLLVIVALVNSCKIEDYRSVVLAGEYNLNMHYQEYVPPLQVEFKADSLINNLYGKDSIDIDLDGKIDIVINHIIHTGDTINKHIFNRNNFPRYSLTLKNGLELANKRELYGVGKGAYNEIYWADTIHYRCKIDNLDQWSEPSITNLLWAVPPSGYTGTGGCWYKLTNSEMYIAIRRNENSKYKFGWIKIYQATHKKMYIMSSALEI